CPFSRPLYGYLEQFGLLSFSRGKATVPCWHGLGETEGNHEALPERKWGSQGLEHWGWFRGTLYQFSAHRLRVFRPDRIHAHGGPTCRDTWEHYEPADKPNSDRGAGGDIRSRGRRDSAAELPVAEERGGCHRGNFFQLHNSDDDDGGQRFGVPREGE